MAIPTIDDYTKALDELARRERAAVEQMRHDAALAHLMSQMTNQSQAMSNEHALRQMMGMQNAANRIYSNR